MLTLIIFLRLLFNPIEWSERPLTIQDFKANYSEYTASACTELSLVRKIKNGVFTYEVKAFFHQDKSYFSKNTTNIIYILQHEQLHFDITEYYARLLRERIEPYQLKNDHESYDEVVKIYEEIVYQWNVTQDKYDEETDHGTNVVTQKRWRDYLDGKGVCH
jgi:hypothetical protein